MASNLQELAASVEVGELVRCFHNKFAANTEASEGETLLKCGALLDTIKNARPKGMASEKIEIVESRVHRSRDHTDYDVWAVSEGKRLPIDLSPVEDIVGAQLSYDPSIPPYEILAEIFFELLLHGDDQGAKPALLQALNE